MTEPQRQSTRLEALVVEFEKIAHGGLTQPIPPIGRHPATHPGGAPM